MNDTQAIDILRRWAISLMKWERAIATEKDSRIPAIKGGLKNLNEAVQVILTNREVSPSVRAVAAATAITETVTESYGVPE